MNSRIYTRKGDDGTTCLADGSRVDKACLRVEAYGIIDEANAVVGAARALVADPALWDILDFLSHRLFNCACIVASAGSAFAGEIRINDEDVLFLERAIDHLEAASGVSKGFVLCGGSPGASMLHVARTVLRRGERALVRLWREEEVEPQVSAFINRASDLLFAAARFENHRAGGDVMWDKDKLAPRL